MTKDQRVYCRIGTSGYQYDHWKSVFYPIGVPKGKRFDYYSRQFNTVEINNTFYNLPSISTFERWHDQAPPGFCYALKFSRYGSHMKKLKDPEMIIGRFLEHAERLKSFLGPILIQLPPRWNVDLGRLRDFLKIAPRRIKWAVEFRDPTWLCEEVYELLRSRNVALCIHDMLKNHPRFLTADWAYLRFHGNGYSGLYSHQALKAWGAWIKERLAQGIAVYAYFNNDACGNAVQNARDLNRYVSEV